MKDTVIQWHPGFVAAMNLELTENRDALIFEKEYNLNTKPLEVDLLVIKKDASVHIQNEIGELFKVYNIMEYKSPKDHLDIDTFYKTIAYACLYKSYGEYVNEREADDITVSIVRETRPEGLFQYFEKHGILVANPHHGIYHILGGVLFSAQIIVTRELDRETHIWLRVLSEKVEEQDMRKLLEHIRQLRKKFEREFADAVLEVSVRANKQILEKWKGDETMCQALLEIMESEILEIKKQAEESGINQGISQGTFMTLCSLVKDGVLKPEEAAKRMNLSKAAFCEKMKETDYA